MQTSLRKQENECNARSVAFGVASSSHENCAPPATTFSRQRCPPPNAVELSASVTANCLAFPRLSSLSPRRRSRRSQWPRVFYIMMRTRMFFLLLLLFGTLQWNDFFFARFCCCGLTEHRCLGQTLGHHLQYLDLFEEAALSGKGRTKLVQVVVE